MSQFIVYSSSDASGPGLLTGQAGSLITVLDACLVNGYTGKAAAGWTKPFANSGNIGCYKNGGTAQMNLVVNDNGPNATSTYKEAWATGWETLAGISGPVGTGTGQFPTPAQLLTTGHVVWRKSTSADATGRQWILFADSKTFYLFIQEGNYSGYYTSAMFGSIYSLAASDGYRCLLIGKSTENNGGAGSNAVNQEFFASQVFLQTLLPGHYMPRTWGGGGSSIQVGKHGDIGKSVFSIDPYYHLNGLSATPNGPDNSLILAPISIHDALGHIRGRLRGIYQVCHSISLFADGQTFSGGGDYAGKTFQIVARVAGYNNNATNSGGFIAVETSNTVETN